MFARQSLKVKSHKLKARGGLSLLEILIVIGILVLLVVAAAGVLPRFKDTSELNSAVVRIVSLLEKSRTETLSSDGAQQHGVHFETTRAVFFTGTSYNEGGTDDEIYILPESVEVSTTSLSGGGQDVVFERLTGETRQDGTITLHLKETPSRTRVIQIKETGTIRVEDP